MDCKIKLKLGPLEVSFEGSEVFLNNGLMDLVHSLAKMCEEKQLFLAQPQCSEMPLTMDAPVAPSTSHNLSANDVATKLGVKNAKDMITAGCAYLVFSEGKSEFSRSEIKRAMESADSFYDKRYVSNFKRSITSLVKSEVLRSPKKDTYGLSARSASEMEVNLA